MLIQKSAALMAGLISLISNVVLTILKLTVGFLFNSQVLVADGLHNAGDVVASFASFVSMRISNQPADEDHPYGHGKAEVVASGIVAGILFVASLVMVYESVMSLFEPPHAASLLVWLVAVVSLIWKQVLYVYTIRIGREINSKGLLATAYDHLSDVYASIAAVAGIGLGLIGQYYNISLLRYGDPVSGIIVSYFVIRLAYQMGRESIDILMEKNVDQAKLDDYIAIIQSIPHVKRLDRIRAREHGHYILVDVRVSIPGTLTIQEGHDISREIKKRIIAAHQDVDEVLIHLNPWYE